MTRVYKPGNQFIGPKLYTRKETRTHWDAILAGLPLPLKTYCRRQGLYRQDMILSVIKHFPDEWQEWKDKVGPVIVKKCTYCGLDFYVNNPRQGFCNRWCYRQHWRASNPGWRGDRYVKVASRDGAQDPAG